jgi:hypothetical protein
VSWRACARELEQTRARLAEAEAALALAREREQITSSLRALAERARGELASCPQCRKPVRGSDLLVSGPNLSQIAGSATQIGARETRPWKRSGQSPAAFAGAGCQSSGIFVEGFN